MLLLLLLEACLTKPHTLMLVAAGERRENVQQQPHTQCVLVHITYISPSPLPFLVTSQITFVVRSAAFVPSYRAPVLTETPSGEKNQFINHFSSTYRKNMKMSCKEGNGRSRCDLLPLLGGSCRLPVVRVLSSHEAVGEKCRRRILPFAVEMCSLALIAWPRENSANTSQDTQASFARLKLEALKVSA